MVDSIHNGKRTARTRLLKMFLLLLIVYGAAGTGGCVWWVHNVYDEVVREPTYPSTQGSEYSY